MNEIICPHCTKAFKIDEAGYANILQQVRNTDFDQQLQERLVLAQQEKANAVALAQAGKDATIQELKGQLQSAEVARELAVTQALSALEKERDALANELKQNQKDRQAAT
ncbi:MAG: DUF2130 domain-containing protein, partial [Gammaproteobacteria bacterium]|nr:DUF2130 domain-containing protein [Gammaproteobacteria bacterium]